MKSSDLLERFAFIFMIICSLAGLVLISTLIHEFSHKQDYEDLAINQSICAFFIPDASLSNLFKMKIGGYYFTYNATNETLMKITEIGKYSEKKAYFLEFLFVLIYGFCLIGMCKIYFERLK